MIACTYSRVSVNGIDSTNSGESRYCPLSHPFFDPIGARIVGRQSALEGSTEVVDHAAEIACAQLQVHRRE